jgi:hypothetical protein
MSKFKVGDKVKVVNYGSIYWTRKGEPVPSSFVLLKGSLEISPYLWYDMQPELVGKQGIITAVGSSGDEYSLSGIEGKIAWYENQQLELQVNPNKEFLQWVFDRMVEVHGENPNYDYMHKFKSIINEK